MTVTRPILRYHGGKWRLGAWLLSHFPAHRVYVEPFGGAASVLLQKPRSYAEVYNDLDGEIVNLFQVARDHGTKLLRAVELTPYSRCEFHLSFKPSKDRVEQARRTLVRSYMGFGCNLTRPNRDQTPQRTGFRCYSKIARRATPAGDWRTWPESLPAIIDRLRGVIIEQRDAMAVMTEHDSPETLHYVDPPYVHSTRGFDSGGRHRAYRHEMTDAQHIDLANFLSTLRGGVILSGYHCALYDRIYAGWERRERRAMSDGARARTEVIWLRNVERDLFSSIAA